MAGDRRARERARARLAQLAVEATAERAEGWTSRPDVRHAGAPSPLDRSGGATQGRVEHGARRPEPWVPPPPPVALGRPAPRHTTAPQPHEGTSELDGAARGHDPEPDGAHGTDASDDTIAASLRRRAFSSALTAYTAAHGHPLDHPAGATEPVGRRWATRARVALAAALVLALLGAVVVGRALSVAPTTFVERAGAATSGPDEPAVAGIATEPVVPGEAADPPRTSGGGDSGPDAAGASAATGAVVVHVVGQVARPGVVILRAGARVTDAIAAAGGATADADLGALNLARVVADGEQVAVLRPGEQAPPPATGPTGGGSQPDGTVDLNQAELADLDALPGIGPVLAQRILDRRGESGRFTSVDELREVTGIGPAVYDGIRDLVRV